MNRLLAVLLVAAATHVAKAACDDDTSSTVSCCFSASDEITQVLINDEDYTSQVLGNLSDSTVLKYLQFNDSSSNNTVLSISGKGQHGVFSAHCTRNNSTWMTSSSTEDWSSYGSILAVNSSNTTLPVCAPQAMRIQPAVVNMGGEWNLQVSLQGSRTPCWPLKLSLQQRSTTALPTKRPTKTPTRRPRKTGKPTKSPTTYPTRKPSTRKPTKSPTTYPTQKPSTRKPSKSPTRYPTRKPSTQRPSTKSPTRKPSLPSLGLSTKAPTSINKTPFKVEVLFYGTASAPVKAAFTAAATRWSQVLGTSLASSVTLQYNHMYCDYLFNTDRVIQDVLIIAQIAPIDGVGDILGYASPCKVDTEGRARFGTMYFDSADVNFMLQEGTFTNTVLHEIGHVLGLGSFWGTNLVGRRVLPRTGGYEYFGEFGNIGNTQVGRTGAAIVEDDYGDGTALGHWKESVYDNELMTGFVERGNVPMPLSKLTIQALKDLGFHDVDLSKADPYNAPTVSEGRRMLRRSNNNKVRLHGCGAKRNNITVIESNPKPGRENEFALDKRRIAELRARRKLA